MEWPLSLKGPCAQKNRLKIELLKMRWMSNSLKKLLIETVYNKIWNDCADPVGLFRPSWGKKRH